MAKALGMALTKLTSKFGILSQKACVRLATETGYKLVDTTRQIGRPLNIKEIESVFAETLPPKCRPQIITKTEDVAEILRKNGQTEKEIKETLALEIGAGVILNRTKRAPIWIPFNRWDSYENTVKEYLYSHQSSTVAHEVEHALEKNNRLIDVFRRKVSVIKEKAVKLFDKDYISHSHEREMGIHKYEENIQFSLFRCINPDTSMNCSPTIEDMAKQTGLTKEDFIDIFPCVIRKNYASGKNKGTETILRLKYMEYFMKMEMPAYKVSGLVDEYIGFEKGKNSIFTGISEIYKESVSILKNERKLYRKNRILGRLKNPNVYMQDKDILWYAKTKEDNVILNDILGKLDSKQKQKLIDGLYNAEDNPENIRNLKKFLDATKDIPNNGYKDYLNLIVGIDSKWLDNPNFLKIAKIHNNGEPAYADLLDEYVHMRKNIAEQQMKKFAKYADVRDINGNLKYDKLYMCIDSPNFDKLKAFTDIEIGGQYPYHSITYSPLCKLPSNILQKFLKQAQDAAKEGRDISCRLEQEAENIVKTMQVQ